MMPVSVAPLKAKDKNLSPVPLGRRTEFSIQLNQIIDATLLVLSLWLAYGLRYELGELFECHASGAILSLLNSQGRAFAPIRQSHARVPFWTPLAPRRYAPAARPCLEPGPRGG